MAASGVEQRKRGCDEERNKHAGRAGMRMHSEDV